MEMRIGHYLLERRDLDAAREADLAQVVSFEVDYHDMLGPLLETGAEFRYKRVVLSLSVSAASGALDGAGLGNAACDLQEALRRVGDYLEAAEVHVRTHWRRVRLEGLHVKRKGVSSPLDRKPVRQVYLVDVARGDILLCPYDRRYVLLPRSVRGKTFCLRDGGG